MITLAPASLSFLAVAAPIPLPDPVTSAALPSKPGISGNTPINFQHI